MIRKNTETDVTMENIKPININERISRQVPLVAYTLLILLPLTLVFFASFKTLKQLYNDPLGIPEKWSILNYIRLFANENMLIYFKNSFFVTFTSVFFILLLGSMISYAIIRMPNVVGNILLDRKSVV